MTQSANPQAPKNSLERLCRIYGVLEKKETQKIQFVSSKELADAVGSSAYSIRKDISKLNISGFDRAGYDVKLLKQLLGEKLNLSKSRKACIVGLGRIGTALLDYEAFKDDGFKIIAGFDSSINKIERIQTIVDVFSVNQLEEIVKKLRIELGIITVPANVAQEISDKLIKGGVRGILNFSSINITVPDGIVVHDFDFTAALRLVAAQI